MMMRPRPLTDGERLWADLMTLAEIGALPNGGVCRLALTDADRAARDLFAGWCREAGLALSVDDYGNMFATRAGRRAGVPHVLVGSHLDTQPHGGRFDGALGVLAGLEIVRALDRAGIVTESPITVVNWTNEEGVRFSPGLTGSGGFTGAIDFSAIRGADGADFRAELARIGYAGQHSDIAVSAYYELHIEQGPVLERAGASVGVVDGVQGVRWLKIDLQGEDRHAGTTPLADRRDAFMAAARLALDMRAAALGLDPEFRITFGRVTLDPGSVNTVPGGASMTVDLRHRDTALLDGVEEMFRALLAGLEESEGVTGTVERAMNVAPVHFDPDMRQALSEAADAIGAAALTLPSGAMHDASNLAGIAPAAMLFVPSQGGISHNEREWTEPAHIALGCEVLAQAVLRHANAGIAKTSG